MHAVRTLLPMLLVGFALACESIPSLATREADVDVAVTSGPDASGGDDVLGVLDGGPTSSTEPGDGGADAGPLLCPNPVEPRCCGTVYCVGVQGHCREHCDECAKECPGKLCCFVNNKGVRGCGSNVDECREKAQTNTSDDAR